jgi:hypothetical protein
MTLLFGLSTGMMVVMVSSPEIAPGGLALFAAALVAGILSDVALATLRPSLERTGALRVFAFLVPATLYACYFAVLDLGGGIWWSIHFWTGIIVMSGIAGLLLSYLLAPRSSEPR